MTFTLPEQAWIPAPDWVPEEKKFKNVTVFTSDGSPFRYPEAYVYREDDWVLIGTEGKVAWFFRPRYVDFES